MKTCLTIAGSDCSGGAGIQADIKAFSANGCFGMSVIVSIVAENTSRVISIKDVELPMIRDQMDAVFEDIAVDGVKIGMLSNGEIMKTVAEGLNKYHPKNVVVDPVMLAKDGCALMDREALDTLKREIIPLAYLLTPNIPEAEVITGKKITTLEDMKEAAKEIVHMGAENVLIKGGHLEGPATDLLYDRKEYHFYTSRRIDTKNTHGTGCTLSSAITANLAKGTELQQAVEDAKEYVTNAITYALPIGKGHGPTNHFYEWYKEKEQWNYEKL